MADRTDTTRDCPEWLGSLCIKPARDIFGKIIGVEIIALVEHDKLTSLPPFLMQSAHDVLDKAVAKDALS